MRPTRFGRSVIILAVILASLTLWTLAANGQASWPNCSFNCTAKDVIFTRAYVDVPPGVCEPGRTVTAPIQGVFDANATRYAVWMIADVFADGAFIDHVEQCLLDTITPGTTEATIGVLSWPCGSRLTLQNMIVSWSAKQAACSDPAECKERRAKCSTPLLGTLQVSTPVVVDFASDSPQCAGDPVVFADLTTGGDGLYTYSWDFGDFFGTSTEANPSYTYSLPGTYAVTLIVTDGAGTTDQHAYDVTVLDCLRTLSLVSQQGGQILEVPFFECWDPQRRIETLHPAPR